MKKNVTNKKLYELSQNRDRLTKMLNELKFVKIGDREEGVSLNVGVYLIRNNTTFRCWIAKDTLIKYDLLSLFSVNQHDYTFPPKYNNEFKRIFNLTNIYYEFQYTIISIKNSNDRDYGIEIYFSPHQYNPLNLPKL